MLPNCNVVGDMTFLLTSTCFPVCRVGDEIKKLEENYNQAQRQWIDNMINACQVRSCDQIYIHTRTHVWRHTCVYMHVAIYVQDYEKHEDNRSGFLKNHMLKYVDLCVVLDETSAVVSIYMNHQVVSVLSLL